MSVGNVLYWDIFMQFLRHVYVWLYYVTRFSLGLEF